MLCRSIFLTIYKCILLGSHLFVHMEYFIDKTIDFKRLCQKNSNVLKGSSTHKYNYIKSGLYSLDFPVFGAGNFGTALIVAFGHI